MQTPQEPVGHHGRWLIEIETWDWELFVGVAPEAMPDDAAYQGRLTYTKGVNITGRVVAPRGHRDKRIGVWLSTFGPERRFGANDAVGHLVVHAEPLNGRDIAASLFLPQDALAGILTCLSSVWKFVHFWTTDGSAEPAVSDFSFSRALHENVQAWIDEQQT